MSTTELEACCVPGDLAFLAPVEGYMVPFTDFYEWGFCVPLHQFRCSLLQYYGLVLHNLTPSGVLHITAFVTLCEAYLWIDPNLDLWRHIFHVRRPQDPEAELMISNGMVIHVKLEHGADPYPETLCPGR
jgi:hypothetical protein